MKINLVKQNVILIPASEEDGEKLINIKNGKVVEVELIQKRNYKFHRKFFAMLNVGYDAFEPEQKEYNGMPVVKNFERFRKDCIISAGFYDLVSNINGEVRAEAKSISFSKMSEEEFNALYNAVANVLLQKVLANYTRKDLDNVVEKLIRF